VRAGFKDSGKVEQSEGRKAVHGFQIKRRKNKKDLHGNRATPQRTSRRKLESVCRGGGAGLRRFPRRLPTPTHSGDEKNTNWIPTIKFMDPVDPGWTSCNKNLVHQPLEHGSSFDFSFEKRSHGPHLVSKNFGDLGHMFFLHPDTIQDEVGGIFSHLILLNHSVHNDPPNRNPKLEEPLDEPRDDGNGKAFGEGDEEKGREGIVGEKVLGVSHAILEAQKVIQ